MRANQTFGMTVVLAGIEYPLYVSSSVVEWGSAVRRISIRHRSEERTEPYRKGWLGSNLVGKVTFVPEDKQQKSKRRLTARPHSKWRSRTEGYSSRQSLAEHLSPLGDQLPFARASGPQDRGPWQEQRKDWMIPSKGKKFSRFLYLQ